MNPGTLQGKTLTVALADPRTETAAIAADSTFLPAVDRAEPAINGLRVTQYSPLFPVYVAPVMPLFGPY